MEVQPVQTVLAEEWRSAWEESGALLPMNLGTPTQPQ